MDRPIYLHIAPELRRSAYYVLASGIPLALVCFWVSRFVRDKDVAAAAFSSGLLFLLCMTAIVPLRWSLRIDERGIARRLLFRWDLWTWDDISSGRIEKKYAYILYDPQRPWWRRRLALEYMETKNISRAMELINTYYRLPNAPPLPDSLEIKYGNFFRRSARFDSKGVHLLGSNETREYLWSDVRRMHITRVDPVRRDFKSLEIVLPEREIELRLISHKYGTSTNWNGATAEVINEILQRYVPADRIEMDIVDVLPARRIDVEKLLARARKDSRDFRRFNMIFAPLIVAILIWLAIFDGVLKTIFTAGPCALLLVLAYSVVQRSIRSRCLELERHLASLDDSKSAAG